MVIVVRVSDGKDGERTMGIVVDAVSEVHNIAKTDLKPAPEFWWRMQYGVNQRISDAK